MSVNWWIATIRYMHAIEYYPKNNEVLILAASWINLENMLSERSQSVKTTIVWFHVYEMYRISKFIETESRNK